MRAWILSFGLGVLLAGYIPTLPETRYIALLLIPWLCSRWCHQLFLSAAFCLGIGWLLFIATQHQLNILAASLEQQDLAVTGTVHGLPSRQAGYSRFTFQVDSLCLADADGQCASLPQQGNMTVLLSDYRENEYLPGQRGKLMVRLKRPHGFANPGGYDYERWLFAEKISATGYVTSGQVSLPAGWTSAGTLDRLRLRFARQLESLPLQATGFITALTIGLRDALDDAQWQLLTQTGTNHLMVISGLHLGLVCWLVYMVSLTACRLVKRNEHGLPAPRLAAIIAIAAGFLYAGIAGFSLPVQRALVMVCCLMSGQLLVRQTAPTNSLCLALFVVLLLDPLAPQRAGFWLSFGAVTLLLMSIDNPEEEKPSRLRQGFLLLRVQGMLFLGLLPLMLLLFGQVSLLAPVMNLVAIPVVGLVIVPLCLLSLILCLVVPPWGARVIFLPDWLLSRFEQGLEYATTHADLALLTFPTQPWWLLVVLVILLLLLTWNRHWLVWSCLGLGLVYAYHYQPGAIPKGDFIVDVLDTGQGLSVVIKTRDHLLVYDTGPAYSASFNAGSAVIAPFLRSKNFGTPDMVMISHGDNDHAGGLADLQQLYPEARYVSGEALESNLPLERCQSGQSWRWNQVQFTLLFPDSLNQTGNNASCVLKVMAGDHALLLPGDIERDVELSLVRQYREQLSASLLVAPHHGSLTSSTPPFVRQVSPDHVVFTAGYLNRFGHPRPAVRARYQRESSRVHETSRAGAVHFYVSASQGVTAPSHYRDSRPRFWRTRP